MLAEVRHINKNTRYRLLTINNQSYIADLDRPVYAFLFPFILWLIPQKVFKIEDENVANKILVTDQKVSRVNLSIMSAGISILIANFLGLIIDYFEINTPNILNIILVLVIIFGIIFIRYYISKKNREKMILHLSLDKLDTLNYWIRPQSIKHVCFLLIYYVFFVVLLITCFGLFLFYKNFLFFLFSIIVLFFVLIGNGMTIIPGKTKVRLK